MKFMDWLRGWEKQEPITKPFEPIEARLPGQSGLTPGRLDPGSPTWAFINSWAEEALQKARAKNDSANRDIVQTSLLRGEIRILKELINLPNPRTVKGLLEDED